MPPFSRRHSNCVLTKLTVIARNAYMKHNSNGYNPGNFQGVIDHIEHVKNLGINVIQLMPIFEFAGDQSWGYNPAHIFSIESAYGGSDMLKKLVKVAHENGIAIVVDVVINHLGPSDIDVWQFDGWYNGGGGICKSSLCC